MLLPFAFFKKAEAATNPMEILRFLGLDRRIHHRPSELSGVFTLRASRSGRICFVAKDSQYLEYSFTLRASHLELPRARE